MWLAGSTLSGSQLGSVWREEAHCQEQVLRIKERGVLHKIYRMYMHVYSEVYSMYVDFSLWLFAGSKANMCIYYYLRQEMRVRMLCLIV